jgi:hypothetical protein
MGSGRPEDGTGCESALGARRSLRAKPLRRDPARRWWEERRADGSDRQGAAAPVMRAAAWPTAPETAPDTSQSRRSQTTLSPTRVTSIQLVPRRRTAEIRSGARCLTAEIRPGARCLTGEIRQGARCLTAARATASQPPAGAVAIAMARARAMARIWTPPALMTIRMPASRVTVPAIPPRACHRASGSQARRGERRPQRCDLVPIPGRTPAVRMATTAVRPRAPAAQHPGDVARSRLHSASADASNDCQAANADQSPGDLEGCAVETACRTWRKSGSLYLGLIATMPPGFALCLSRRSATARGTPLRQATRPARRCVRQCGRHGAAAGNASEMGPTQRRADPLLRRERQPQRFAISSGRRTDW